MSNWYEPLGVRELIVTLGSRFGLEARVTNR